jgi:heme/copper-type cytochrome/quinol oxidase subunit 2
MGLGAKSAVVYIGIAITVIFLGLAILGTYCLRKINKSSTDERYPSQLGISLQEVR